MVLYFEDTSVHGLASKGDTRLQGPCRWEPVHAVVYWCKLRSTPVSAGLAPCPTTRMCHYSKGSEVETLINVQALPQNCRRWHRGPRPGESCWGQLRSPSLTQETVSGSQYPPSPSRAATAECPSTVCLSTTAVAGVT